MPYHVDYGVGDAELDDEGRLITVEYEKFYLVCVYVPNSGRGLVTLPKRLRWNKLFAKHMADLDAKKPVIICGDMNVAHQEIGTFRLNSTLNFSQQNQSLLFYSLSLSLFLFN